MKRKLGLAVFAAYLFTMILECTGQDKSLAMRISEELYVKEASVKWEPYFTGEEPEWVYNPDEPWTWNPDGNSSRNQALGQQAYQDLYAYLANCDYYAACYINSDGYLTVMLTNPTLKKVKEITERSAAPVWIIAAKYPHDTLQKAFDETWAAIAAWKDEHPEYHFLCTAVALIKRKIVSTLHYRVQAYLGF